MNRLSGLDASFLALENDVQHMHVGSALIFEGPVPTGEEFSAAVDSRLHLVPRYRQRVSRLPLDFARPVWIDDQRFRLSNHVKRTALASPGSEDELRALVARVMAARLDRAHPLWEIWLVEGLSDGRWAIINKIHHALIDGISGHDILELIMDPTPHPPAVDAPRSWSPAAAPSSTELVVSGVARAVRTPLSRLATVASAAVHPRQVLGFATTQVRGLALMGEQALRRPSSVLNGPLGPHRRWGWASSTLADASVIRKAWGGTVNDVILAAISGGFREFLLSRGESVHQRTVRSMVPVSIRTADQKSRLGNEVTAMFADLPVGIADPVERLHAVSAQLQGLKGSGMAIGMHSLIAAGDFVPPTLFALGARLSAHVPQRYISTVTTNVPGPQIPLYFRGRRMLAMYPYIPLGSRLRITIGIVSYHGQLAFGVTGDRDAVPDVDVLCRGIETAMADLLAAAVASTA